MLEYHNEFEALDPSKSVADSIPMGTVYMDHRHIGEKAIARSPFYAEYFHRYGVSANMAARLARRDGMEYVLSFQRERLHGNFRPQDEQLLLRLMPHLQRAAELCFKFSQLTVQAELGQAALDHLVFPVLLVRVSGEVAMANTAARAWLATPRCPLLQGRTGAQKPAIKRLLQQACGVGGTARTSGLNVADPLGDGNCYLLAIPLRRLASASLVDRSLAMLVVQDRRWEPVQLQALLHDIFGLSAAEVRLIQRLLHDDSLTEAAEQLHLSIETVRTHLKSIFKKTDTRRQGELLQLMGRVFGVVNAEGSAPRPV